MGQILKKIAKVLSSILFAILIGIAVILVGYVITIKVMTKQDRLGDVPINFYTILTQSMYPKIKAGDIIVTYKNTDNLYKVGDVITFVSSGSASKGIIITHRIVERIYNDNSYSYATKGDNNSSPDGSLVNQSDVIGKVILKVPKAGYIQQFLLTKFGWIVAIVLPALGIIIYDIVKLTKKVATKNKEKELVEELLPDEIAKENLSTVLEGETPEELAEEMQQVYEDFNIPNVEEKNIEKENLQEENIEVVKNIKEEKNDEDIEIL